MEPTEPHPYEPAIVDGIVLQAVQAHVLFRHGDRSPTPGNLNEKDHGELWATRLQGASTLMPKLEPYYVQEHPWGQLTQQGARQARELGSWLRRCYWESLRLSAEQPSCSLAVRSTTYKRTHMTAWYVLEGLLESPAAAALVPITRRPEHQENLYNNESCPRLQKLWRSKWRELSLQPDGNLSWQARYQGLKQALQLYFGLPKDSPYFPWLLAMDVINCWKCHGDALPAGVIYTETQEVVQRLARNYMATFQNQEICQLSMGRLLGDITASMGKVRDQTAITPSLFLYSGHDATILPLSVCLGSPWKTWPFYASFIVVELLKPPSGDQLYVRVLYNGKEEALSVWQAGSALPPTGTAKQSLFTLEQFMQHVGWCLLTDHDFRLQCHRVSDL